MSGFIRPLQADPNGIATVFDHIRGADPRKSQSPYTSFSFSNEPGKSYGNSGYSVDVYQLQRDIGAGFVKDVQIIDHNELIKIHDEAIRLAQERYNKNPTEKNQVRIENAERKKNDSVRDQEVLIKGVVPKRYIYY